MSSDWFGVKVQNNTHLTIVDNNSYAEDGFGRDLHIQAQGRPESGKWAKVKEVVGGIEKHFGNQLEGDLIVEIRRASSAPIGTFTVHVYRDQDYPTVSIYKRLADNGVRLYYVLPGNTLQEIGFVAVERWQ